MPQIDLLTVFKKNKTAVAGAILTVLVIAAGILAPLLSPYDPLDMDMVNRLTPPSIGHLLGTDEYGRDVLSRIIWSTRISISVGILSVAMGLLIGTTLGMVAGYAGGLPETGVMRMVDVLLSFPTLITGIMVAAILGTGQAKLIITIGIVLAPRFARLAHGPTLTVKEMDYVNAARTIGAGHGRIILYYLLPNIFGELVVAGTLWVGTAIMTEASLSFLGLGVSPPTPTWGNMIKEGIRHLTDAPWLCFSPGTAILITVLSINMLGDGLRDIADPKLRG